MTVRLVMWILAWRLMYGFDILVVHCVIVISIGVIEVGVMVSAVASLTDGGWGIFGHFLTALSAVEAPILIWASTILMATAWIIFAA